MHLGGIFLIIWWVFSVFAGINKIGRSFTITAEVVIVETIIFMGLGVVLAITGF